MGRRIGSEEPKKSENGFSVRNVLCGPDGVARISHMPAGTWELRVSGCVDGQRCPVNRCPIGLR